MKIEIEPLDPSPRDASAARCMETPFLVARQMVQLEALVAAVCRSHLTALAGPQAQTRAFDALHRFAPLYDQRPVRDNSGGSGFNDSLWLFVVVAALAPRTIVESGVHKGHGTWLLRQACPDSAIFSFDITFKNKAYHDDNAKYYEHDWMDRTLPFEIDPKTSLVFFDDHISHAARLSQARERGFTRAIFDDNFPAEHLYATGGPPVPTLAMLRDDELNREPETELVWRRNGKRYRGHYRPDDYRDARQAIKQYLSLPDLAAITRFSLGSGLSLVEMQP